MPKTEFHRKEQCLDIAREALAMAMINGAMTEEEYAKANEVLVVAWRRTMKSDDIITEPTRENFAG